MTDVTRSEVPAEFKVTDAGPQMTERQEKFIRDLLKDRVLTPEQMAAADEMLAKGLTRKLASAWIDRLRALPLKNSRFARLSKGPDALPDVPQGRYAIDIDGTVKFYHIDKPTDGNWAGFTFVKVRASDDLHPIKNIENKRTILQAITDQDPAKAARRFGLEIGKCGVCGRTLTDETSRAYGIGPICRDKTGW